MRTTKGSESNSSGLVIYEDKQGKVELRADIEKDTIWATQAQVAQLFNADRSVITKHFGNIFKDGELFEDSVCANFAHTAEDGKQYMVKFYNLDAIIAVGYRVNSKKATQFRIWATGVLRNYLTKGYVVNQQRLLETQQRFEELQKAVAFIESKSHKESLKDKTQDILELLSAYSRTLSILERYDKGSLADVKGKKASYRISYENCLGLVIEVKRELTDKGEASDLFGIERTGGGFEGAIKSIYQTWDSEELYPTIEDKAANLLYFIIKDHPFSDGNKRLGSIVFLHFLHRNKYLIRQNGERKINDTAMAALALLVAESDPKEKEIIVKLTKNLVN
ncbi:MAG: virulence protein RhuM/Fic/DOC family protein [Candidatus Taylorbacteria bacterium]